MSRWITDEAAVTLDQEPILSAIWRCQHADAKAQDDAIERLLATVPLTAFGARCALAYLAQLENGYHLRYFVPTLLESPLFNGRTGFSKH